MKSFEDWLEYIEDEIEKANITEPCRCSLLVRLYALKVTCPALQCGASPVPPAFTANDFIREFRAGSRQPHPIGLFIRWATHCPSLPPHGDVIGNIPIFSKDLKYLKLPFAYPRFEKQGFAGNDFINRTLSDLKNLMRWLHHYKLPHLCPTLDEIDNWIQQGVIRTL